MDEYLAIMPPQPHDSSSGCAKTARMSAAPLSCRSNSLSLASETLFRSHVTAGALRGTLAAPLNVVPSG